MILISSGLGRLAAADAGGRPAPFIPGAPADLLAVKAGDHIGFFAGDIDFHR
jgi:hypothetical protein